MPLPVSYLLGLFCIITADDLTPGLPNDPDPARLYPYLLLLAIPWLLARFAWNPQARAYPRPATANRLASRLLGLPGLALRVLPVPLVMWALLCPGDLRNLLYSWIGESGLVMFMAQVVPLFLLEASAEAGRRQAVQASGSQAVYEAPPLRGTLIGFLTLPPLMFFASLDLIGLNRQLELLVHGTGLGVIAGTALMLVCMSVILPVLSRWVLPISGEVSEDVRETASLLGFPPRDVVQLNTRCRVVNAGLVGPLPGFQFLILSDGLLRTLDPLSLRGVVAHEVGHARAHHPLLLVCVVVLPLLFLHPLLLLGLGELGEPLQLACAALVALVGLRVVRLLAHRFEMEADQLSSEALGGAGPCILALLKVGAILGGPGNAATFRHPSDEQRIDNLLKCEGDPWFRELFHRRGVRLRRWILGVALLGVGLSAWAQTSLWSMDRLVVSFYSGRFEDTAQALAALPAELSESDSRFVTRLREELVAAQSACPGGGRWEDIRDELARSGWERGEAEMLKSGGAAARAWFALAVSSQRNPTALQRSLYLYSDAAASEDEGLTESLRRHLLDNFELPAAVATALRR